MINSTLGFIYTPDYNQVLLITKHKPIFHKGKLNGIGGKCEKGESATDCITRETQEETALLIPNSDWKKFGELSWTEWQVTVFATVYKDSIHNIRSLTQDPVAWYNIHNLPKNVISNLRWLVPLGIDILTNESTVNIKINYS